MKVIYYLHRNTDQPSHAIAISTNNLPRYLNDEPWWVHFWHSLTCFSFTKDKKNVIHMVWTNVANLSAKKAQTRHYQPDNDRRLDKILQVKTFVLTDLRFKNGTTGNTSRPDMCCSVQKRLLLFTSIKWSIIINVSQSCSVSLSCLVSSLMFHLSVFASLNQSLVVMVSTSHLFPVLLMFILLCIYCKPPVCSVHCFVLKLHCHVYAITHCVSLLLSFILSHASFLDLITHNPWQ